MNHSIVHLHHLKMNYETHPRCHLILFPQSTSSIDVKHSLVANTSSNWGGGIEFLYTKAKSLTTSSTDLFNHIMNQNNFFQDYFHLILLIQEYDATK